MCDEFTAMRQPQQAMADMEEQTYPGLSEGMVEFETGDGTAEAFFVHPAEGKHPGVVFWPDAIGLRETKKQMGRRLASSGYAVLVVNQYYRNARTPLGIAFSDFGDPEKRERIMPLFTSLTPDKILHDGAAYVAFLDAQDAVDTGRGIGTQGYCMGGSQAIRTGAAARERVKAVASFHGGGLVTDAPDSPHRVMAQTDATYLILPGKDDDEGQPEAKDALREAAEAAGLPAEIEVYKANHSWCVPDAPAYDKPEAERAWERLLALYTRL